MLGKRKPLNDLDILCTHHKFSKNILKLNSLYLNRFIRTEDQDKSIDAKRLSNHDYGEILAKKYYDKLYKEFAIIDLSNYKTGKFFFYFLEEMVYSLNI